MMGEAFISRRGEGPTYGDCIHTAENFPYGEGSVSFTIDPKKKYFFCTPTTSALMAAGTWYYNGKTLSTIQKENWLSAKLSGNKVTITKSGTGPVVGHCYELN